jgi:hypothetical protein
MKLVEFPTAKEMKESVPVRKNADAPPCLELTVESARIEYSNGHTVPPELDELAVLVEEAAIEAMSKMCRFRRQGDYWRASIYADLAAGRFQYLTVLLARQSGAVYAQTSSDLAIK